MNIYQKLISVRKSVPYLKKDNQGYQFKYVSSSQTLGALREAMDENQLLLIPRIVKWEIRDHTTRKGDHEYFTILDMEFTWVNAENPEETIVCPWQGCGLDDGEKGTGKGVTYGEKYFLLKFFNIASDKDDPDSFQKKPEKGQAGETTKPPPSVAATEQQKKAIHAMGTSRGLDRPGLFAFISKQTGYPTETTDTLTKKEASNIIKALNDIPEVKNATAQKQEKELYPGESEIPF